MESEKISWVNNWLWYISEHTVFADDLTTLESTAYDLYRTMDTLKQVAKYYNLINIIRKCLVMVMYKFIFTLSKVNSTFARRNVLR